MRRSKIMLPGLSHFAVAGLAFYAGVLCGGQLTTCSENKTTLATIPVPHADSKHENLLETIPVSSYTSKDSNHHIVWPDSMQSIFVGAARVPRDDFMQTFDVGVPLDPSTPDNNEVFLLYGSKSMPTGVSTSNDAIPLIQSTADATRHCHVLKQVLLQPKQQNDCFAIVGQWESWHVHKWLRTSNSTSNTKGLLDANEPFQNVARTHTTGKGKQESFPRHGQTTLMATQYGHYMSLLDELYAQIKPIAAKVASRGVFNNTVIVMVCNKGQSMILANFVCAAKSRGLDTSKILLFASDLHTQLLAESLGLTTYHHDKLFADMPVEAAKMYGDQKFKSMMMAKVYVVHLINLLGHDVLFQDVDMIWFKDPLTYFGTKVSPNFDIYFQDDGQHSVKYAPYSPNTGFYYVKQNIRTRFLLSHLVRIGDVIMNTGSHQDAMTTLMAEHSSWRGLRVKVISRDEPSFPCGYHFHQRPTFMNEMLSGKTDTYIFHMSWTDNKDQKTKYLQQLGEWYVSEEHGCAEYNPDKSAKAATDCCLSEPMFRCHYKGKPSKKPC